MSMLTGLLMKHVRKSSNGAVMYLSPSSGILGRDRTHDIAPKGLIPNPGTLSATKPPKPVPIDTSPRQTRLESSTGLFR